MPRSRIMDGPMRPLPTLTSLAALLVACDGRIEGPDVCVRLAVVDPVGVSPLPTEGRTVVLAARSGYPASSVDSPDYALSWIKTDGQAIKAATMSDPFTTWPPLVGDSSELVPVSSFQALAPTDRGPGLLVDGHRLLIPG